ncbi:hypothetical protein NMY22_g7299 [Coprinellus aureogranulatus]|nr:hypothetical protein NMY22_g7299 [Coprinellus aureogranulatus]
MASDLSPISAPRRRMALLNPVIDGLGANVCQMAVPSPRFSSIAVGPSLLPLLSRSYSCTADKSLSNVAVRDSVDPAVDLDVGLVVDMGVNLDVDWMSTEAVNCKANNKFDIGFDTQVDTATDSGVDTLPHGDIRQAFARRVKFHEPISRDSSPQRQVASTAPGTSLTAVVDGDSPSLVQIASGPMADGHVGVKPPLEVPAAPACIVGQSTASPAIPPHIQGPIVKDPQPGTSKKKKNRKNNESSRKDDTLPMTGQGVVGNGQDGREVQHAEVNSQIMRQPTIAAAAQPLVHRPIAEDPEPVTANKKKRRRRNKETNKNLETSSTPSHNNPLPSPPTVTTPDLKQSPASTPPQHAQVTPQNMVAPPHIRLSSPTPTHPMPARSISPTRSSTPGHSVINHGHNQQQQAMSTTLGMQSSSSPSAIDSHTQIPATTFFQDAHDVTIGSLSIQVTHVGQADPNTVYTRTSFLLVSEFKLIGKVVLEPYISHGAAHDSNERCDAPQCSPETREAIQAEVIGLIRDGDVYQWSKRITWLGGPAGAGKTAIAGSVAVACAELGLLAGTFFFSSVLGSGDTRRTKRCVVTTLAYQLARRGALHEYRVQLLVAIKENPDIFSKCLQEQAQRLILDPFRAIHGKCDTSNWPRGILYDGLDEVKAVQYHDSAREDLIRKDEDDQLEILKTLLSLANSPDFPFRIFISSRPERIINQFFTTTAKASTVILFLDSKYEPDADIERFLQSKLAVIREDSGISNPEWPGDEVIGSQLEEIMQLVRTKEAPKNPFALLDLLYTHITNRSPDPRLAVVWIRCIIASAQQLDGFNFMDKGNAWVHGFLPASASFWKAFLEDIEGEFSYILSPLASLISIPPLNDRRSDIKIYHKSFTDFLNWEVRSGALWVQDRTCYEFAAGRYVSVLKHCGPKVPIPSDLQEDFLSRLLWLQLLPPLPGDVQPRAGLRRQFSLFFFYLRQPSLADLTACDVAWWTRLILTRPFLEPSTVPCLPSNPPLTRTTLLGDIYCAVHTGLTARNGIECNSNTEHGIEKRDGRIVALFEDVQKAHEAQAYPEFVLISVHRTSRSTLSSLSRLEAYGRRSGEGETWLFLEYKVWAAHKGVSLYVRPFTNPSPSSECGMGGLGPGEEIANERTAKEGTETGVRIPVHLLGPSRGRRSFVEGVCDPYVELESP